MAPLTRIQLHYILGPPSVVSRSILHGTKLFIPIPPFLMMR
jgi:hypothetical protein